MKTKILNALKTEYAKIGLSDKALDGVASFLEKTITEESQIETAVKEAHVVALVRAIQGDADGLRSAKLKAERDLEDYKKAHPAKTEPEPKPDPDPKPNDEVAQLLKQMSAEIASLKARNVEADKKAKVTEMIQQVRSNLVKENRNVDGLLDMILENPTIGDADTVDALTEKYKGVYDTRYKSLYGDGVVPPAGGGTQPQGYQKGQFNSVIAAMRERGMLPKENKE